MNVLTQRVVSVLCLLVGIGLYIASDQGGKAGYEFPRMVALTMAVLSLALAAMAFKPGKALLAADIESVPMRIIWPMLLILIGLAFLAPRLGFFSTSFLVFSVTAVVFDPNRLSLRGLGFVLFVSGCFTVSLYLLFVRLLNVRLPDGLLF